MLLFVLVVFSAFVPNYFQLGIFANIIEASSVLGIMSIGLALVIIAGHMDLSVESVAALSAMAVGILFCSAGIGIGLQLNPAWLAVPVSLLMALGRRRPDRRAQRLPHRQDEDECLHHHAGLLHLGARPRARDFGRTLGAGSRACDPLVRHPAPARPAADGLAGDLVLCRLLVHHGQDAVRPPSHHDRRQRNGDVPRRHPRQPQSDHRLRPGRRHRRPGRLGAGDPHLRRHRQSRHRPAVQRLCRRGDRRRQPERRRRLAARRLCRRAACCRRSTRRSI